MREPFHMKETLPSQQKTAPVGALSSETNLQRLLMQVKRESEACDTVSSQHSKGNHSAKVKMQC